MVDPYADKKSRMTDGIYPVSKMIGDAKFHTHQGINASTADKWAKVFTEDFLGDVTWEVAQALGYEMRPFSKGNAVEPPPAPVALSPIPHDLSHDEAQELLDKVHQMSDQDVEALLQNLVGAEAPADEAKGPA
jgi:hypothetical protein